MKRTCPLFEEPELHILCRLSPQNDGLQGSANLLRSVSLRPPARPARWRAGTTPQDQARVVREASGRITLTAICSMRLSGWMTGREECLSVRPRSVRTDQHREGKRRER